MPSACRSRQSPRRKSCVSSIRWSTGLQLQALEIVAELPADFRVGQCQLHGSLQEAFLAAAVVANALVGVSVDRFFLHQRGNAVGQLDFATGTLGLIPDLAENAGHEDVAARNAQAGGRFFWL